MAQYSFHCTDGHDLIVDRKCTNAGGDEQALGYALLVAERLMLDLPDYENWTSWMVCVYDDQHRMVGVVPFDRAVPALANRDLPARRGAAPWTKSAFLWPSHHPSTE